MRFCIFYQNDETKGWSGVKSYSHFLKIAQFKEVEIKLKRLTCCPNLHVFKTSRM